jgi:hypothetical protein
MSALIENSIVWGIAIAGSRRGVLPFYHKGQRLHRGSTSLLLDNQLSAITTPATDNI